MKENPPCIIIIYINYEMKMETTEHMKNSKQYSTLALQLEWNLGRHVNGLDQGKMGPTRIKQVVRIGQDSGGSSLQSWPFLFMET